jgi:hypothetical protein
MGNNPMVGATVAVAVAVEEVPSKNAKKSGRSTASSRFYTS